MDDHYPNQSERLNQYIDRLEFLLTQLETLLQPGLTLTEKLEIIDAVGRLAIRLNSLLRTQKHLAFMIYEVEDRLKKRELQEQRILWQSNR
jgi:hypothetical protein